MLAGTGALACSFDTYIPDDTTVDRMLGSDHIVLARAARSGSSRLPPSVGLPRWISHFWWIQ